MMKRKGITPIIAIIILLLIVVALAGLAYTYISGVVTGQTEESFAIQPAGAFCDLSNGNNTITVVIMNLGTSASITPSSFIIAEVNNGTGIEALNFSLSTTLTPSSIPAGESGQLITECNNNSAIAGCSSGSITVRLSTAANTGEATVICP